MPSPTTSREREEYLKAYAASGIGAETSDSSDDDDLADRQPPPVTPVPLEEDELATEPAVESQERTVELSLVPDITTATDSGGLRPPTAAPPLDVKKKRAPVVDRESVAVAAMPPPRAPSRGRTVTDMRAAVDDEPKNGGHCLCCLRFLR